MTELFYIAVIIIDIVVIADVLKKFRGGTPRALWIVFVLALPMFGAAIWYYVQYMAPKEKRLAKEERSRIKNNYM